MARAFSPIPAEAFRILLCHSPEVYRQAEGFGTSFFLAGHTHGGQICLPGRIPVISHAPGARGCISGLWRYRDMVGHTGVGAGSSGVPARFFCPPEIAVLTLRRAPRRRFGASSGA